MCEVGGRIASCGMQMSGGDWLLVLACFAGFCAASAVVSALIWSAGRRP